MNNDSPFTTNSTSHPLSSGPDTPPATHGGQATPEEPLFKASPDPSSTTPQTLSPPTVPKRPYELPPTPPRLPRMAGRPPRSRLKPLLLSLLLLALATGLWSLTPSGYQFLSRLSPSRLLSSLFDGLSNPLSGPIGPTGPQGIAGEPGTDGTGGTNGANACISGLCVSRQQDVPTIRELGHIHLAGSAAFGGNLDIGKLTTLYGALTVHDTTTLNDTLTVNANSTLYGALTVDEQAKFNSALTVAGNTTLGGSTTLNDVLVLNANIASHLIPNAGSSYDLGSSSNPWRNFYVDTLTAGTLTTGFTEGSIIFADSSGNLAEDNTGLFWDNTNKRLGVGTGAPAYKLVVSGTNLVDDGLVIENTSTTTNGYPSVFISDYTGTTNGHGTMLFHTARGSKASPAAVVAGQTSGALVFRAYDGTSFKDIARIQASTGPSFSTGDQEGILRFFTGNATSYTEHLRLSPTGGLSLGSSYVATDPGSGSMILSGVLGIGTTTPSAEALLNIVGTSSTAPSRFFLDSYGATSPSPQLSGRRARGTTASPTAVSSGDTLLLLSGRGHDGLALSGTQASIGLLAAESWTTTAKGTNILFLTTANGSTVESERMRIHHNGNLSIATANSGSRLVVKGTTTDSTASGLNVTNSSDTSLLFVRNDGNVGIGTTSPAQKLNVIGLTELSTTTTNPHIILRNTTIAGENRGYIGLRDTDNAIFLRSLAAGGVAIQNSAGTADIFNILNSGNVGLGTTTPGSYNSQANNLVIFENGDAGITIAGGASNIGSIRFADGIATGDDGRGYIKYFHASDSFTFGTNNSDKLTILSSGNVGIGTTTPDKKLEIVGGTDGAETSLLQIRSNFTSANTATTLRFANSTSVSGAPGVAEITALRVDSNGAADLIFRTSNNTVVGEAMRIRSTGNVGIGLTSGINSKLTFAADTTAAGGILFGTDTNLYRSAADTLRTDDSLLVTGRLEAGSTSFAPSTTFNTLSMGYEAGAGGWIQSYGTQPLRLNPVGNDVKIGDASGASNKLLFGVGSDTNLFRRTADQLGSNDLFISERSLATDGAFAGIVTGDTVARWHVQNDGRMAWGNGASARDTNLYRIGADVLGTDDDFAINLAGKGLKIKEGTNAKMGTATLVGGTATVSTTAVAANSRVFLTSQSDGGTPGFLRVSARTAGTSFTITSSSGTDTSTVAWLILDPS